MYKHAEMMRETYEQMGIVEKLAFWETMPPGTFVNESWIPANNWGVWLSEVCREARSHILGQLVMPLTFALELGYRGRIGKPTGTVLAVTGEHYVEITSLVDFDASRDVEQKHRNMGVFKTYDISQEAIDAALHNFRQYELWWAGQNPPGFVPRLYWRIPPEIDTFEGKWKVYMRCLLSAKPPLDDQSLSLLLSKRSSSSMSPSSP